MIRNTPVLQTGTLKNRVSSIDFKASGDTSQFSKCRRGLTFSSVREMHFRSETLDFSSQPSHIKRRIYTSLSKAQKMLLVSKCQEKRIPAAKVRVNQSESETYLYFQRKDENCTPVLQNRIPRALILPSSIGGSEYTHP